MLPYLFSLPPSFSLFLFFQSRRLYLMVSPHLSHSFFSLSLIVSRSQVPPISPLSLSLSLAFHRLPQSLYTVSLPISLSLSHMLPSYPPVYIYLHLSLSLTHNQFLNIPPSLYLSITISLPHYLSITRRRKNCEERILPCRISVNIAGFTGAEIRRYFTQLPHATALEMIDGLLPDGEIILFDDLFPAKTSSEVFDRVLFLAEIFRCSLPSFVILLPPDWWAR